MLHNILTFHMKPFNCLVNTVYYIACIYFSIIILSIVLLFCEQNRHALVSRQG